MHISRLTYPKLLFPAEWKKSDFWVFVVFALQAYIGKSEHVVTSLGNNSTHTSDDPLCSQNSLICCWCWLSAICRTLSPSLSLLDIFYRIFRLTLDFWLFYLHHFALYQDSCRPFSFLPFMVKWSVWRWEWLEEADWIWRGEPWRDNLWVSGSVISHIVVERSH